MPAKIASATTRRMMPGTTLRRRRDGVGRWSGSAVEPPGKSWTADMAGSQTVGDDAGKRGPTHYTTASRPGIAGSVAFRSAKGRAFAERADNNSAKSQAR